MPIIKEATTASLSFRAIKPQEDAYSIQLRQEDADEAALSGPLESFPARFAAALQGSQGLTVEDQHGRIVAMFGITQTQLAAIPWLRCSKLIEDYSATVWRVAKRVVNHLQAYADSGDFVGNQIGKQSSQAREFLQRLGFCILPQEEGDFDVFVLKATHV